MHSLFILQSPSSITCLNFPFQSQLQTSQARSEVLLSPSLHWLKCICLCLGVCVRLWVLRYIYLYVYRIYDIYTCMYSEYSAHVFVMWVQVNAFINVHVCGRCIHVHVRMYISTCICIFHLWQRGRFDKDSMKNASFFIFLNFYLFIYLFLIIFKKFIYFGCIAS